MVCCFSVLLGSAVTFLCLAGWAETCFVIFMPVMFVAMMVVTIVMVVVIIIVCFSV